MSNVKSVIAVTHPLILSTYKTLLRVQYGIEHGHYPAAEKNSEFAQDINDQCESMRRVLLGAGMSVQELDALKDPPPTPTYEYIISFSGGLPDETIVATDVSHAMDELNDDQSLWPAGADDNTQIVSVVRGEPCK